MNLQEPYVDVEELRQRQSVSPLRRHRYLSTFSRSPSSYVRHQRPGPNRGVSADEDTTSAAGTKTVKRQDDDDDDDIGEVVRDPKANAENGSDDVPCPRRRPTSAEPRPCATGNRGIGNCTRVYSTADRIESVSGVGWNVNNAKYSADRMTAQCSAEARDGQCCSTAALAADQEASELSAKRSAHHILGKKNG